MSAELCRHPGALQNFLKLRRPGYQRSFRDSTFWDGKIVPQYVHGEPMSAQTPELSEDVTGHMTSLIRRTERPRITPADRTVYRAKYGRPSAIAEGFRELGINAQTSRGTNDPLRDPKASQEEKLSEALKREREGTLNRLWRRFLQDARSHFAGEQSLALEQN